MRDVEEVDGCGPSSSGKSVERRGDGSSEYRRGLPTVATTKPLPDRSVTNLEWRERVWRSTSTSPDLFRRLTVSSTLFRSIHYPPHLFREERYRYAAVVYLPQCEIATLKLVSLGRELFCGARNRLLPAVLSLTDTDALVPVGYPEFLRELNRIEHLPTDIMPRCEITSHKEAKERLYIIFLIDI